VDTSTDGDGDSIPDNDIDLTGARATFVYPAEGIYIAQLLVNDSSGNTGIDPIVIKVLKDGEPDTEKPVADAGQDMVVMVEDPVIFNANASSDNFAIVEYLWDIDTSTDSSGDGTPDNDADLMGIRPEFSGYPKPGVYEVLLRVNDAGLNGPVNDTLIVSVSPNLEIVSPAVGAIISGEPILTVMARDQHLANVTISIQGSEAASCDANNFTSIYCYARINTSDNVAGLIHVEITGRTTDGYGHTIDTTYEVDNVPPSVTVNYPMPGEYTENDTQIIDYTATDDRVVGGARAIIGDLKIPDITSMIEEINFSFIPVGSYEVAVTVADTACNTETQKVAVNVVEYITPICGDWVIDFGEYCDNGELGDPIYCTPACTPRCGDGQITETEQCEPGIAESCIDGICSLLSCQCIQVFEFIQTSLVITPYINHGYFTATLEYADSLGFINTQEVYVLPDGTFDLDFLPSGVYNMTLTALPYLRNIIFDVSVGPYTISDFGLFIPGDINNDNVINGTDDQILLSNLGTGDPDSDLNKDGIVDGADILLLQEHMFKGGMPSLFDFIDGEVMNQAPLPPFDPFPENDQEFVSIQPELSWSGGDPDPGDTVTYDIYFGTDPNPPYIETIGPYPATQTEITYDPEIPLDHYITYYWKIVAEDNHNATAEGPVWSFTTGNNAPVLNPIPNQEVYAGQTLAFQVSASDADNDPLIYDTDAYSVLPSPPAFNSVTGAFEWTPTLEDAGVYEVTFSVSDGQMSDNETITITVNNVPWPPVLQPISDKVVDEMWGTVRIRPVASDPNNDPLEYSIDSSLFTWGGTFFTWRPGPVDSGEYDFLVSVTDGEFWDSQAVHVTVEDTCTTYNKYERCWVGCNCPVERDENKDIGFEGDALGSGEIQ